MTQQQWVHGDGKEPEHAHPAQVHSHDHYHITHHHKSGVMGEWDHKTSWHSHEHNHAPLRHSHDGSYEDEVADHDREAHIHDHTAPAESPA